MILVGQFDSPYTRRVAISLRFLGFSYEHDTRSVFGDFDSLRSVNPLGRIPVLILDDGEVIVDSAAMLDWLDQMVGPARALVPPHGAERRRALKRIALATGAIDKIGAAAYERLLRPAVFRWPEWIARCRTQGEGALAALADESWSETVLDQATLTAACAVAYARMADPELAPPGRFPALDALADRCEQRPEFMATRVSEYALPQGA